MHKNPRGHNGVTLIYDRHAEETKAVLLARSRQPRQASSPSYAWDMPGGGFPYEALWSEMRAMGVDVPQPPSPEASRIDVLRELWTAAGLGEIETREIVVRRTFADFEDYWTTVRGGPSTSRGLAAMPEKYLATLKARMAERLAADAEGRITCTARANAVKGRVGG